MLANLLNKRLYSNSRQLGSSILISDTLQIKIPINTKVTERESLIYTMDLSDSIEQLKEKIINHSNQKIKKFDIIPNQEAQER